MQTDSTTLNSALQGFFVTSLQEMYWSEVNMRNSLSTMTEEATTAQLKQAFQRHAEQTETHAKILENVFALLGIPPQQEPSVGLQGLFDEGWQVIDESEKGSAQRDVALIIAAQKVEHYEIASYGSLSTLAKTLGHNEIVKLLESVLEEEKETDAILTSIAESGINFEASQEPAEQSS
jgi:ferritin-like metal-binding protein YciE